MVVQGVALPKISGGSREQDLVVAPAEGAAAVAPVARDTDGRVLRAAVIVPMLAVTELAWLGVLGYAFVRFFL